MLIIWLIRGQSKEFFFIWKTSKNSVFSFIKTTKNFCITSYNMVSVISYGPRQEPSLSIYCHTSWISDSGLNFFSTCETRYHSGILIRMQKLLSQPKGHIAC